MTEVTPAVPDQMASQNGSGVGSVSRLAMLRSVLAVAFAVVLVIPESEIRQKAFKANLVAKNLMRSSLHAPAHR